MKHEPLPDFDLIVPVPMHPKKKGKEATIKLNLWLRRKPESWEKKFAPICKKQNTKLNSEKGRSAENLERLLK